MKSTEIRRLFIDYFVKNGHEAVKSSGLIPKDDPTLLFTNAGMVQFKGVFLNEETRACKRAVSCQKCMRAGGKHNDLENVGRTYRHHTFFEMLGNFSFGDYFKEGAIVFAWDFLANVMRLPKDRLWVTVFETDDEAAAIWKKKAGLPDNRIIRMGAKDNFWSMGETGPCGPCSEIIIDQGQGVGCGAPECSVACDCDRFLELWNLVFMQHNRGIDGELTPLPKPSIDTGMGLERLSAVMQGKKSNYDSDLFTPIISEIEAISSVKYGSSPENDVSIRAIADHARAAAFLMADGVLPGNDGRGYVLRRILRRSVRHGRFLGVKEPFIHRVSRTVIGVMGEVYPEIRRAKDLIIRAAVGEEERFLETLERGLVTLEETIKLLKKDNRKIITGAVAFKLYDTYGFPVDLTADIVRKDGFTVDEDGFTKAMDEQRQRARLSWKGAGVKAGGVELYKGLSDAGLRSNFVGYHMEAASSRILCIIKDRVSVEGAVKGDKAVIITEETPFYGESGGQAGDTGIMAGKGFSVNVIGTTRPYEGIIAHHCEVTEGSVSMDDTVELVPDLEKRLSTARNHTATHILHGVMRKTLGEHVRQAGSLVAPKGLRFDFNHFEALAEKEIKKIEEDANRAVISNIEVITHVVTYQQAIEKGALAFFGEKYGDIVRMVEVPGVSAELCGGTHVKRTGDIGLIKITGVSSVAAGVRRIEAVTGPFALEAITITEDILRRASDILKAAKFDVPERIERLMERQRELEKEIEKLKGRGKSDVAVTLIEGVRNIHGVNVLAARVEAGGPKELREMADALRAKLGSGIVVLAGEQDGKALLLAAVTRDLAGRYKAGEIIKRLAPLVGGKGGGSDDMAQAGGNEPDKLDEAVREAYRTVEEMAGRDNKRP